MINCIQFWASKERMRGQIRLERLLQKILLVILAKIWPTRT
jgi:hypothetical protein